MNLVDTLKISLTAISSNKIRSFLTMLGVIIGVFSVVSMISLGRGVENYITDEFNELGSNLIFVSPGRLDVAADPGLALTRNPLEQKHVDLIIQNAGENLDVVTPYIFAGSNTKYKNLNYYSEIVGVSYDAVSILNYDVAEGRSFSNAEQNSGAKVAVIGPVIKKELFSNSTAIGKSIRMNGENFEIIGTFGEKGSNYDDQILVPYTAAVDVFDLKKYASIVAQVNENADMDIAIRQTEFALLRDLKEGDFTVLSQEDLLSTVQEVLTVLTVGLGAIAGISLVVGGIGIMNILLVSVSERIKEIGLRKALGATPFNIGLQFMVESLVISLIGGTFGLILGWLLSLGARSFLRTEVPFYGIVLAFGFSVFVGVVFGTYPAYQASKKDPVEAMRHE